MPELIIRVTRNDSRFETFASVFSGVETVTPLWSDKDLSGADGGGVSPVIFLAHANTELFTVDEAPVDGSPKRREAGDSVVGRLVVERGLDREKFGFCLIAGCSAASPSLEALFVKVGRAMGKPVIASTTTVALNRNDAADRLTLQPIEDGEWKVFFPYEGGQIVEPGSNVMHGNLGGVHGLDAPQCAGFRAALATSLFEVRNADGSPAV